MSRPIDATALVKLVLEERDKIPLEVVERYSFGVPSPNKHGQSMRGGIRKVLRLIEQAPTLDYAPVRHGEWKKETGMAPPEFQGRHKCSLCFHYALSWKIGREELSAFCPNCGALMDGKEDAHV